jgi:hypothetical protein
MAETIPGPSGPGTVVLNVGGGMGALVLNTPAELDGAEIEISRHDAPPGARRTHSQVRRREVGSRVLYAAVYPDLAAGDYTLWRDAVTPAGDLTISGTEVTTFTWPVGPGPASHDPASHPHPHSHPHSHPHESDHDH